MLHRTFETPIKKTFPQYGQHTVTLETGEIARQASGAVLVNMADTVVLVTVVAERETEQTRDFLPLRVDYQNAPTRRAVFPGAFFVAKAVLPRASTLTARPD